MRIRAYVRGFVELTSGTRSVRSLVSIVPSAILLTSIAMVLLVLLSPTVILSRSTSLLDVRLDANRTLSLGPLGE